MALPRGMLHAMRRLSGAIRKPVVQRLFTQSLLGLLMQSLPEE